MSLNTPSHDEDAAGVLQTHQFTAGPKHVQSKQTPYGKLVKRLSDMTSGLEEDADIYPDRALDDKDNENGQYAIAYRKALNEAHQGKYEGLMRVTLGYVNIGPEEVNDMTFDEMPTPAEAEAILFAMGKKEFPELANASFTDVCDLWGETQEIEVPPEFYPPMNRNMNVVLPVLRRSLQMLMLQSGNLLNPVAGPEGVRLCYAMMELERRLSMNAGQVVHPNMTMRERLAADNVKRSLDF